MLASEQRYLAEIILTQLRIKVPNFDPKTSNFACKSQIFQISFQKMLRSLGLGLGLETFAKFLWEFRFRKIWSRKKSLGFGIFGLGKKVMVSVSKKFGLGKKVLVLVSEKFGLGKKSRYLFLSKFWYRHSVIRTQVNHS